MRERILESLEMPQAWQVMVDLSQQHPIKSRLSACDWKSLRVFTVKNNLATLVHTGAQQILPPEYRNYPQLIEIRLLSKMSRIQSQNQIEALGRIVETFRHADIPVLSFKGPLLAQELYGDPAMRNSCDLDILVENGNMSAASRCLQSLGYVPRYTVWDQTPRRQAVHRHRNPQMHRVFRGNGITVELHWRICYRFAVPFEELWKNRRQCVLSGQVIDTLSQSENLCYLITHGAGHGFRQLRWLLEIYALLKKENFSVSPLYVRMKERGVAALLLETLLLLYRLPGFNMPDRLCIMEQGETVVMFQSNRGRRMVFWQRNASRDMAKAQKLVNAVYPLLRRNNPEEGLDGRIYKHLLPIQGKRPAFLLTLLEPGTADLEWVDLPDKLFFLYYFLRPIRFLLRMGKKKRTTDANGGKQR